MTNRIVYVLNYRLSSLCDPSRIRKDGLGNCSYCENNLNFSHGAAIIPEEDATKDVNGKITVANITGEKNSGFLYSVDWYDNSFFREIKCAKTDYSSDILAAVVELARQIDNNV